MHGTDYQEKSARTIGDPKLFNVTPTTLLLLNAATGLSGESGEFVDHIKKHVFHGAPLDLIYVKKELGDIMFYVAMACTITELNLDEVMCGNVEKLMKRHPEGFTIESAQAKADETVDGFGWPE